MSLCGDLAATGIAVVDDYLAPARVRALIACMAARRAQGELRPARVGGPGHRTEDAVVRGDATCWIESPLAPAEAQLLADLETLRLRLNRELQLGLFELEIHYASYAPGAGYQRHVDQPHGRDRRRLSLVLYLNEDWEATSGGQLRLHQPLAPSLDVSPAAGRLVCFLSAGREHEVLPATRERLSVTGWFLGR